MASFVLRTRVFQSALQSRSIVASQAARSASNNGGFVAALASQPWRNNNNNHMVVRAFASKGGIEDRAHALEERAAREHDQQVLAALAKTLEAKKKKYAFVEEGAARTKEWRLFVTFGGERISAWHDVPLVAEGEAHNLVVEMPLGTVEKMEVNLDEEKNPMKQDVKNGELRVIKYGKSKWNYGMLPQTWEDSNATLSGTNFKGDGDPLDVVEIGGEKLTRGTVAPVRVLGAIALIDEGELDWKVVAIALSDPNASKLNDIGDVERVLPGKLDAIVEWYRNYKTVDGKGVNQFAFDGKFINRVEALKVIEHCNKAWKKSKKPKAPPKAKKTTA